jgi:hypothetical protein
VARYLDDLARWYSNRFYVALRKIAYAVGLNLKTVHKWVKRLASCGLISILAKGSWVSDLANSYRCRGGYGTQVLYIASPRKR